MAAIDWRALVVARARATGAPNLPTQTIAELDAHLEDIYLDALSAGRSEREALDLAKAALQESALSTVPKPRMRPPDAHAWSAGPSESRRGIHGVLGDARYAWRQLR